MKVGRGIWKPCSGRRYDVSNDDTIIAYILSHKVLKSSFFSCLQIETLSKVNHKNFVNLIGYCEEEKPFTRMMVFEYAPNGTLFEHLHSEHLTLSRLI